MILLFKEEEYLWVHFLETLNHVGFAWWAVEVALVASPNVKVRLPKSKGEQVVSSN